MAETNVQKQRLEELLSLAQNYRGCSRKQLAKALGRDASNLVPDSGIPKVDLVVELSKVLDWPVEDVIHSMWSNGTGRQIPDEADGSYAALDAAAVEAHRTGRYQDMIDLARTAYAVAEDGEQRAKACNREAGGWDGLGQFRNALEALQKGLREAGASRDRQLLLRSNLANAYYTLWQLYEGKGVAGEVIHALQREAPTTKTAQVALATALYVRGHCHRRLLGLETARAGELALAAHEDLTAAAARYHELAEQHENDSYAGIANTCLGGLMEVEVVLGRRDAESVLSAFADALDALVDPDSYPVGDWLESYGWWCIFGCNVALRCVSDERELQHTMAIFTNKADEIAQRLGNWSMRERVFTMEYARRQRFADWTGVVTDWTIDDEDVRVIAGTMGRFPAFHETGWQILRTAKVIAAN